MVQGLFFGDDHRRGGFDDLQRVAEFAPGVQSALQRADMLDALSSKEQRHTGAGGFVWSSAVEDDFAVGRQAVGFFLQLLCVNAECAGNGFRVGFKIHGVAEVHDDQLFAGIDFRF